MSAKKTLTLILCMVLVAALSVAGTLAYLTSTDSVTNTFTAGSIAITMDEAKTDAYGNDGGTRTEDGNTNIILLPGHEYIKDPTIHVTAGSESSWLFVKVENGLSAIETNTAEDTIHAQIKSKGWTCMDESATNKIYYKMWNKGDNGTVYVFDTFTVEETVINSEITAVNGNTIKVTAYAVQAAGFETAALAWSNTFGA